MCLQLQLYYACGCPQSTSTTPCLGSLGATKRHVSHKTTSTRRYLDETCPRGCKNSAFVVRSGGTLEVPPAEKTVGGTQPPPQLPDFKGTALKPAGDEFIDLKDLDTMMVDIGAIENTGPECKSLVLNLCYPRDIQCFTTGHAATEDASSAIGTALNPAGDEKVEREELDTTAAAANGTEDPGSGCKSVLIKLSYPSDIQCFSTGRAAIEGISETEISLVMQHCRSENNSVQRHVTQHGYSGVMKNPAPRVKKARPFTQLSGSGVMNKPAPQAKKARSASKSIVQRSPKQ